MVISQKRAIKLINSKKITEQGRSMTEMLGVLAVIGVLSIGGILGFRLGLNKWRANELVAEINMRSVALIQQLVQNPTDIEMEMGDKTAQGYAISSELIAGEDNYFYISVEEIPTAVCREILNMNWDGPAEIYVNEYAGSTTPTACGEGEMVPLMDFKFHKMMDVTSN